MNKGLRHELKMTKYKRRVSILGYEHTALRTTSKPCSCVMCSPRKFKSNGVKKKDKKELEFQIKHDLLYLHGGIIVI